MTKDELNHRINVYKRTAVGLDIVIGIILIALIALLFVDYSGSLERVPLALILILLGLSLLSITFHCSYHIGQLIIINSIARDKSARATLVSELGPFNPVTEHIKLFREIMLPDAKDNLEQSAESVTVLEVKSDAKDDLKQFAEKITVLEGKISRLEERLNAPSK